MILKTKLYPPKPPAGAVTRSRLFDRLSTVKEQQKHLIITAGAGYGKSTLLVQWMDQESIKPAWISLDEHDNNPARFFSYIAAALHRQYGVDSEPIMTLLKGQGSVNIQPVLETLVDVVQQINEAVFIVLDDLHLVENEEIYRNLDFLLKYAGNDCSFVFISRFDPPLTLSKLRLEQKLLEMRESELRFQQDEIQLLINSYAESGDIVELTGLLQEKTEGWAVGLQLAILAWQQERETDFVQRFSGTHTYIADYLMEEVLQGMTPEIEENLLAGSLFDRFNHDLLEVVLERELGEAMSRLSREQFFLISLDGDENWFRYHHLVRDLLKKRALSYWNKERIGQFLSRAAGWFERHKLVDEAIACFHEAGNTEEMTRLIASCAMKRIASGEMHDVSAWLDLLAEDRHSTADLCVIDGWLSLLRQDVKRIEFVVNQAGNTQRGKSYIGDIDGHLALLKANYLILYPSTRPEDILKLIKQAGKSIQKDNLLLQGIQWLYQGNFYRMTGDLNAAGDAFRNTILYADQMKDFSLLLPASGAISDILITQGKFNEAEQMLLDTLEKVNRVFQVVRIPQVAILHILMARILFEKNKLAEAENYLDKAEEISIRISDHSSLLMLYEMRGRLELTRGDLKKARSNLDRASELAEKQQNQHYSAFLVHLTFLTRKASGSKIALEQCLGLIEKSVAVPGYDMMHLEKIQVEILSDLQRYKEALARAQQLKGQAVQRGARYVEFQLGFYIALLHWQLHQKKESLASLHESLLKSERSGAIRSILDIGSTMSDLLKALAADEDYARDIPVNYIRTLLSALDEESSRTPVGLSEPLSDRELEVLRLLTTGLSNKEIGDQLYLALGTVKKHTFTIYQKLDVKNRIQAVEKARELMLV